MKKQILKAAGCALLVAACLVPSFKPMAPGTLGALGAGGNAAVAAAGTPSKKYPFTKIQKTISEYKKVNNEVAGWLLVPGTNINEPIVLNTVSNNYYVKRTWDGKNYPDIDYKNWNQRPATASYLDNRTIIGDSWRKGTSRNLVIYGHNWNNLRESNLAIGNKEGFTMFAQLPSYTNLEFATQNPYIYFSTEGEEGVWKVFSAAYCELSPNFNYNTPNPSKESFEFIINEWKARSLFKFDTDVNADDRILTLSTCTRQYDVGEMQRYVVCARLLREGESDKDAVRVAVNENWKRPVFR